MTTYASSRLPSSMSKADLVFNKMKQDQYQHDLKIAVKFLNQTLETSLACEHVHDDLKDGVLLCQLINKIRPGTIRYVGQKDLPFVKMDNITRFLQGARQIGLNDTQLFNTVDLFEAKDMMAVIHTILVLAKLGDQQPNQGNDRPLTSKPGSDNGSDGQDQESASVHPYHGNALCHEHEHPLCTETSCQELRSHTLSLPDAPPSQMCSETISCRSMSESSASAFIRPPKSPLRPQSKPNAYATCPRPSRRHKNRDERHRRPSAPSFSSTSDALERNSSGFSPTSRPRSDSTASCSSSISSISSSSSVAPQAPVAPTSPRPSTDADDLEQLAHQDASSIQANRRRRQSMTFPHRSGTRDRSKYASQDHASGSSSLGHKLDRQFIKSIEELQIDDGLDNKLLLQSKDGSRSTQYQLGNCIGKGQFGAVYRALDLTTGEVVAVKRVKLEDGELDQEIMQEVNLLKTLAHVNVIRYLGFIRNNDYMNIVLEYAENGSLMSTLKAFGAFPERLVASFCIKILGGLEYLHANDVVHCDLKAANILTTKTGNVKLTDFGVSLNLKIKGADPASVNGTPNWIAPEVIELKGASTKSDIWSLGCTLVELVTGKPPYADLIAMSAMFRIVEDDYPPLPENISEEMHSFLLCCFQKNPIDRPTASQLKEHIWLRKHQGQLQKSETYAKGLEQYLHQQQHASPAAPEASERMCHPLEKSEPDTSSPHSKRRSSNKSSRAIPNFLDDAYRTHRFLKAPFGKAVECKVCGDVVKKRAIFCEVCSLLCHEDCRKFAFACPPRVNDQQPSYDWVFTAKTYNAGSQYSVRTDRRESSMRPKSPASFEGHPQAEHIRKYSRALGLTPQEQRALYENAALLQHTLSLQHIPILNKTGARKKSASNGSGDYTTH